jgi:hypothetical protein
MPSLLALLKNAVLSGNEDASATHARSAALAEARPSESDAQAVAAYHAWVARDNDSALRFALRADAGPVVHFHALLVLTAVHAEKGEHESTYKYAKRLIEIKPPGRVAHAIIRPALILLAGSKNQPNQIDELSNSYQEWVSWAQEFVVEYERTNGDA